MSTPKSFFITSSPFACGITWLVNAFLELGIRGNSLRFKANNWRQTANGGWTVTDESREHMLNHLTSVANRPEFKFRDDVQFFWEHRISVADSHCPVVVVTRDPRDAIFSLHRRWTKQNWIQWDFKEFLERPSEWPEHFPGLFHLNPIKTYLMFNLIWKRAAKFRPVLFVRFEDLKTQPEIELRRIFKFLNINVPSSEALEAAIEACSMGDSRGNMGALFKGEVYEWKRSYDVECLRKFEEPEVAAALELLGYPSAVVVAEKNRLKQLLNSSGFRIKRFLLERIARGSGDWRNVQQRFFKFRDRLLPLKDLSYWEWDLRRMMTAELWAQLWAGGLLPKRDLMRKFLYELMTLVLKQDEIEHVTNKGFELSKDWTVAEIDQQNRKYFQLNALEFQQEQL